MLSAEIEADCDIKSSKVYKHWAQSSQSHQLHSPEGTYHEEMTEMLLSSGAEGNQSKASILCCKWVLQKGDYMYRPCQTERLLKMLPKKMDVLSKVNRDQHIPSTKGERGQREKRAMWRGLAREQFRVNLQSLKRKLNCI